jgi:uncharacterized membrane protein
MLETKIIRAIPVVIAAVGLIYLGISSPDKLGAAAVGGLTGIVGGYYGATVPGKQEPHEEEEEKPSV